MSFKPYTEKINKKKNGIWSYPDPDPDPSSRKRIRIRIKMIRIRSTVIFIHISVFFWFQASFFFILRHMIPRASLKDAGPYTCKADNGLGKVSPLFYY